jgi:hypothetical protein
MKILLLCNALILSIALISCSERSEDAQEINKEDNAVEERESINNKYTGTTGTNSSSGNEFEKRIQEGEIILLYNDTESAAFRSAEDEVNTITLPDGKMYEVEKDDDVTLLNIPGKGKMEVINLNDTFYLFDEQNQAYEVKYINNKLFAEATSLTDVLLERKK